MQRFLTFLSIVYAVALAGCATAPEKPVRIERPPVKIQPAPQAEVTPTPLVRVAPPVAASVDRPLESVPPPTDKNAHVALLLPLNSPAFSRAAETVKQGFMAAFTIQPGDLPIKIYPSSDQAADIVAAYSQATQAGARIVVGPLTKSGVTALAASKQVSVPTLALNLPERDARLPPQLYLLALAADIEARQIAQTAFTEGRKSAVVIASGNGLARRMQFAFAEEWVRLGGKLAVQLSFNGSNADAVRDALQRRSTDMLFLAMDGGEARLLRPYLNPEIPTYATSQIYAGANNPQKYHDLNGIRFTDMPWLLQPDHLAVMVYPRSHFVLGTDLERLYALGIDAWRLALMLRANPPGTPLDLDGVTGHISLDPESHQFIRMGVQADFRNGDAVPLTP